jgi:PTS system glucitol/sorbitol-specific IIC component
MDFLVNLAAGFMNLFTLGGQQFVSWVTGIIPTVLMLLVLMNAIIALAGEDSVNKLNHIISSPYTRLSAFFSFYCYYDTFFWEI